MTNKSTVSTAPYLSTGSSQGLVARASATSLHFTANDRKLMGALFDNSRFLGFPRNSHEAFKVFLCSMALT